MRWLLKLVVLVSCSSLATSTSLATAVTALQTIITKSIELYGLYHLEPVHRFPDPDPPLRHSHSHMPDLRQITRIEEGLNTIAEEMNGLLEQVLQPTRYREATESLAFIRQMWIQLVKSTDGNCSDQEYLAEQLASYLCNVTKEMRVSEIVDRLSTYFHKGSFLFKRFVTSNVEKSFYDVEQSRLSRLERFIDGYSKTQYEAHLMWRIASKVCGGWRDEVLITRWNNIARQQAKVAKELKSLSDSEFRPDPRKVHTEVAVRRISVQSVWCRSHFFIVLPKGDESSFAAYPTYPNVQLRCIDGPNEIPLKSVTLDEELPCENDFMGATHRYVSKRALMVADPDTQFICRLSLLEDFCTRYPTVRIKADVCDKRNTSDLHKVDTIYLSSSISDTGKVTWPFIIEPNYATPTQIGYVVGVQLFPVNRKLRIGFHTSFREPISNGVGLPTKYKC